MANEHRVEIGIAENPSSMTILHTSVVDEVEAEVEIEIEAEVEAEAERVVAIIVAVVMVDMVMTAMNLVIVMGKFFFKRILRSHLRCRAEESCRVFVQGLDPSVTEDIIRDHFSPYGKILHVKLPKNHETGRQRDLALITMDSPESVDRAVANASFVIMGKRVKQICVSICGRWEDDL